MNFIRPGRPTLDIALYPIRWEVSTSCCPDIDGGRGRVTELSPKIKKIKKLRAAAGGWLLKQSKHHDASCTRQTQAVGLTDKTDILKGSVPVQVLDTAT